MKTMDFWNRSFEDVPGIDFLITPFDVSSIQLHFIPMWAKNSLGGIDPPAKNFA
jgi:hypothetical protein